jgi:dTDP-4-dehydrorhamnose reductase
VYATSKADGEVRVLAAAPRAAVARVGNVYGRGGRNFAARMRELLLAGQPLRVDCERRMSPTSARAIAAQTVALLAERPAGILHMTCAGDGTWFEFATALAAALGLGGARIEATPGAELKYRVHRPSVVLANNALARIGLDRMPPWREALADYVRSEAG